MTNTIVLVHPYFRTGSPDEQLFRPLGLACLASQMKSIGLPVYIEDCTFKTFDDSIRDIVDHDPAIVGIHVAAHLVGDTLRILGELRDRIPGTLFIAGGPMPTVSPERFAREFDVVFRGESDQVLGRFCRDYLALRKRDLYHQVLEFYTYPGVYTVFRSQVMQFAPMHHPTPMLDTLPVPYRKDQEHERYQEHWMRRSGVKPVTMMAARGCPGDYGPGANPVFGRIFRKRSLERILREIDVLARDGYNQFWFVDDNFTFHEEYVRSFCAALSSRETPPDWTCMSRAFGVPPRMADIMRRSGCSRVLLNFDSGSEETLLLLNRKNTIADAVRTINVLNRMGIQIGGSFIVGYPGETESAIEQTLSFALSHPFDQITFNTPFSAPYTGRSLPVGADEPVSGEGKVFIYSHDIDAEWLRSRIAETQRLFSTSRMTEHFLPDLALTT